MLGSRTHRACKETGWLSYRVLCLGVAQDPVIPSLERLQCVMLTKRA